MQKPHYDIALAAADEVYKMTGVHVNPDILWAQMVLETGWFSSPLSKYHNYGGMKTTEDTGLPAPKNETGFYKIYDSDEAFGRDWAKTIAAYIKGAGDNPDLATYVHALKNGPDGASYFDAKEQDYLDGLTGILGKSPMTAIFSTPSDAYGSHYIQEEPDEEDEDNTEEASIGDRFWNQFLDSAGGAGLRTLAKNISNMESIKDMPLLNDYTPSIADIKYVQDQLPNDITAQSYVLNNATSAKALRALTEAKVEDIKRRERVDNSDISWASIGAVAGALADPLDTLAFIPGLGAANVIGKATNLYNKMTKLQKVVGATRTYFNKSNILQYGAGAIDVAGKVASTYPKTMRYGKAMVEGAVAAGTDRFLAERWGGFEPDYAPSIVMGSMAGGFLRRMGDLHLPRENRDNPITVIDEEAPKDIERVITPPAQQQAPQTTATPTEVSKIEKYASAPIQKAEPEDTADIAVEGSSITKEQLTAKISKEPEIIPAQNVVEPMAMDAAQAQLKLPPYQDFYGRLKLYIGKNLDKSKQYVKQGSLAEALVNNGKLAIMSKQSARNIARKFGIKIDKNAQAMTIPGQDGFSIIFSDKLTADKLDGLVAHEVGVHLGLRRMMGDDAYETLLKSVSKKITPPRPKRNWKLLDANKKTPKLTKEQRQWIEAGKAAEGDPEEALAYWAEKYYKSNSTNNSIINFIKSHIPELSEDKKINDLITRSIQKQASDNSPVITMADGSHVVNGVYYSKDNAFNSYFSEIDDCGEFSKKLQNNLIPLPKFLRKKLKEPFGLSAGRSLEHGQFWGIDFGIMANSHGKETQKVGVNLMDDPRKRPEALIGRMGVNSVEGAKDLVINQFLIKYNNIVNMRRDYLKKTLPFYKRINNSVIRSVDEQIIRCFDAKYGRSRLTPDMFDNEIVAIADEIKGLRDSIIKWGKKTGTELGENTDIDKGIIDADWVPDDESFYRIVDNDKWTNFMMNFKTKDDVTKFLDSYAHKALKRDIMQKRYADMIDKEKKKFDEEHKDDKSGATFKPSMTYKKYEKVACRSWANQMVERQSSEMGWTARVDKSKGDTSYNPKIEHLTQFQRRLPMDTSIEVKMENGGSFIFDDDLRNYDIDIFLPQILNKSAGEIAIHGMYGDKFPDVVDAVRKENEELRITRGSKEANREWEAFMDAVQQILGDKRYALDKETVADALSSVLRTYTYSRVGGQMTFAQTGEFGGMVGYGGLKTLFSIIPSLESTMRKLRLDKDTAKIIERTESMLRAEDIQKKCWDITSSTESRWARQCMGIKGVDNPNYKLLGAVGDILSSNIKRAGLLTSELNIMTHLTDSMIEGMRRATIEDCLAWAQGKKFYWWRKPFSEKKLAAAGIDKQRAEEIKTAIKKYLIDGEGDVEAWMDEDPTSFCRWKILVDNQAKRGIQQMTVGGSNLFKSKHKILMQFKDFTMRAINEQTLRALTNREKDDLAAMIFSMGTNMLSYWCLTQLRALAMYPDDTYKRKKFIDKSTSWQRMVGAAITRGAITGSLLSIVMDGYEALTGTPMFRTSVDNTYRRGSRTQTFTGTLSRMLGQVPAVGTASQFYEAGSGAVSLASGHGHAEDFDAIIRALPLGSWMGLTYLSKYMKEGLNLREERK